MKHRRSSSRTGIGGRDLVLETQRPGAAKWRNSCHHWAQLENPGLQDASSIPSDLGSILAFVIKDICWE
ncbi:hypothetical protein Q7C36_019559 [Tachysurus vachellii]|uniref:Uncharacterized protein n=1 Tax=Tachysurus vachellii TaxID=175792 RepID=A0AA88S8E6_TACVA|nr:hypothetical protein Q7C36_019559 [Tachysurus vachellii]